jgi:hypothetical protein
MSEFSLCHTKFGQGESDAPCKQIAFPTPLGTRAASKITLFLEVLRMRCVQFHAIDLYSAYCRWTCRVGGVSGSLQYILVYFWCPPSGASHSLCFSFFLLDFRRSHELSCESRRVSLHFP